MKINNETKIGLMVLISVVILLALTVKAGDFSLKKEGYPIKVQFRNIDGVDINSPVMFNGFEVGVVNDIEIKYAPQETVMELSLWLEKGVKLREGTVATVKNLGFMGEKYVSLSTGETSGADLKADSVLTGKEPPNFEDLLLEGKVVAKNLKEITSNINERLDKNKNNIDDIIVNLKDVTSNVSSITGNVDDRLKKNEKYIDGIVLNLRDATVNLEELSLDLKLNPWKLLHRSKAK